MTRMGVAAATTLLLIATASAQTGRYDVNRQSSRAYRLSSPTNDDAPRGSTLNTVPTADAQGGGPLDRRTQPGSPGTYGR